MRLSPDDQAARADSRAAAVAAGMAAEGLLLPYQARVVTSLRAGVKLLVVEKSRRIGLTWATAFYAVMRAAASRSGGGDNVYYMGFEQEMAREFIDTCAMWAKALAVGAGALGEEIFDDQDADGKSRQIKAFRIDFASGFKIVVLPSMPRAFRGRQGVVIIDEAAFHGKLEEKLKSALALLLLGGQVVVISTHDGVSNPFNLLIDKIRAGQRAGEVVTITFRQAIADGAYERFAEVARRRGLPFPPRQRWIDEAYGFYGENAGEELDVIPKEHGGSLIKPEDLNACQSSDAARPELYAGGLYFMGRDIARRRDGQIIWGFELVGDVAWLRDRWEGEKQTFQAQWDAADALIRSRRMMAYWLDQGGMGEQPVEDAKRAYGANRVQGQFLQGRNRMDIALSLADRFERGLIRVPADPIIRADLLAIKRIPTSGGGITVGDDPDGTVHADRFWAAALASRAADLPVQQYDYRPVGRSAPPAPGRMSLRPRDDDDLPGRRAGRSLW